MKKEKKDAIDSNRSGVDGVGAVSNEPDTKAKQPGDPAGSEPSGQQGAPNTSSAPGPQPNESLDSIAAGVESAAPEPNTEAVERAKKKRGPYVKRGKYSSKAPKGKIDESGSVSQPELSAAEKEKYLRCYTAGAETIEGLVGLMGQSFGPEWNWRPPQEIFLPDGKKVKIGEREIGRDKWGRGFAYKGWEGPNPMVSMFIWSLGFAISRLNQPETRKKALNIFQKLKEKFSKKRKVENLAHPGSGDNGVGKNDPGKEISQ